MLFGRGSAPFPTAWVHVWDGIAGTPRATINGAAYEHQALIHCPQDRPFAARPNRSALMYGGGMMRVILLEPRDVGPVTIVEANPSPQPSSRARPRHVARRSSMSALS